MAGWCIFSPSMLWRPAWGCTRDCNDSLVILQTAVIQLLFPAISVPVPVLLGEGFISMHVASAKLIAGAKISTQCSHIEQILSLDCWTSNYKEMWSQAKILCEVSRAIGCWMHPFQESRIWFIRCLCPVLGLFLSASFTPFPTLHPVSISCQSSSCYLIASSMNDT